METSTLLGDTSVTNVVPPNQEMQDLDVEVNDDLISLLDLQQTHKPKTTNCNKKQ